MLSNRESARRSRKRKQEHLETLEEQVQREAQEKSDLLQRLDEAERLAKHLQAENKALRAEVAELRLHDGADQVRTGRAWGSYLKSSYGAQAGCAWAQNCTAAAPGADMGVWVDCCSQGWPAAHGAAPGQAAFNPVSPPPLS